MINIDEINAEIAKLEKEPTTYSSIQKLSWLYTVRDHIKETPTGEMPRGDSDYYCACSGKSISEVMAVMNELMDALMVIQPRLYDAVLMKLS